MPCCYKRAVPFAWRAFQDGKVRTQRFDECVGLKVKPRKGDALLFWSMTPERTIDAVS